MPDIIIHCDGVRHGDALSHVAAVISAGYISEAAGIPHYCWATKWSDGVVVYAHRKRTAQSADSFVVRREDGAE